MCKGLWDRISLFCKLKINVWHRTVETHHYGDFVWQSNTFLFGWRLHFDAEQWWYRFFTFTYPLTPRVVGHHRWFHNQFPPFFSLLHCPLGLGELRACPFPDVVFTPLSLSALPSSPFRCALPCVSPTTHHQTPHWWNIESSCQWWNIFYTWWSKDTVEQRQGWI